MSLRLFMDVHVARAVTLGLRRREVDVVTAQEDGSARLADPLLLDRATTLGRVLFSQDDDLLAEASIRQGTGAFFSGVIYSHQGAMTIGAYIEELELIAKVYEPTEMACRVEWIPLR